MGKKKSVVLMILLTIVIVALTALTVFPTFPIPWTVKKWNPAVLQYDLGMDLGGGYYAYYYPEGVISETEYKSNLERLTDSEEKLDYVDSYVAHGGLYLSKDEDLNIIGKNDTVTSAFEDEFNGLLETVKNRYEKKGYSEYRITVEDDYAIRVEVPKSDQNVGSTFSFFSYTGALSVESGGETVEALKSKDASVSDLIKGFSVGTQYKVAYIKVKFTKEGKEMLKDLKDGLSNSTDASSSTDTSSLTSLDLMVGENKVLQIFQDHIADDYTVKVPVAYEENKDHADTVSVLLNSALAEPVEEISVKSITTSEIRTFEPVLGKHTLTLLFIALAVVIAASIGLAIWKMGRYGIVCGYTTLSYLIVTGICFAFISGGIFEVNLGTALVFVVGLVLTNALSAYTYNAIKAEFEAGKTVESSVKGGYKKTVWGVVDIYAVLLLGALALLIGGAGLYTVALQAIICIVTGAFCNLLWGRAINYVFLSASKDKYKYFRFVREDDDDE